MPGRYLGRLRRRAPGGGGTGASIADAATTSASKVARGSLWELSAFALPQLYVVVTSALIARVLGAAEFGRLTFIASLQAAIVIVCEWGVPFATMRFVAELFGANRQAAVAGLVRWTYRTTGFGALTGIVVMVGIAATSGPPHVAWYLAAAATPFAIMHSAPSAVLTGAQRWRDARIFGMVTGFGAMIAKIGVVSVGGGISALFAVDLCVVAVNFAGTLLLARRVTAPLPPAELPGELATRVRSFARLGTVSVLVALIVYQRTEIFALAHFKTDADIARYSVPYALVSALLLFPSAVAQALSPAFATLWGAGEIDRIRSGFGRGLRLVIMLALGFTAATIAVGQDLITLVYGHAFDGVQPVLLLLALSIPFVPLASLSSSLLRGIGVLGALTVVGVVASVADIALAVALVPPFNTVGAAVANTLAQILGSLPLVVYSIRRIGGVELAWGALARAAVAFALACAAGLALTRTLGPVTGLLIGGAAFVAVLIVAARPLRVLARDDAVWVAAVLGTRFRGLPAAAARYAGGL
jgi:O-antigen/teichoic acid export membrane protein